MDYEIKPTSRHEIVLLQDFFVKFLFGGQYRFAEIGTVNPVSGNELHTAAGLAVV